MLGPLAQGESSLKWGGGILVLWQGYWLQSDNNILFSFITMPIPSLNSTFLNVMGVGMGNGIFPCFFAFFEKWSMTGHHAN